MRQRDTDVSLRYNGKKGLWQKRKNYCESCQALSSRTPSKTMYTICTYVCIYVSLRAPLKRYVSSSTKPRFQCWFPMFSESPVPMKPLISRNGIKRKKKVTINLDGKNSEFPSPQKQPVLGFSDTLRHV